MIHQFQRDNFEPLCEKLCKKDGHLAGIVQRHGYPPMWTRPATFATLVHIILEQQVSLASARAAFHKLKEKTGRLTAQNLLQLSDVEMKACYFSRQKMGYARHLAGAVVSKQLSLARLKQLRDEEVKQALKQIKGIGDWTAEVYLIFALQRTDIFPAGDLAMVNALKEIKQMPKESSREAILAVADKWRPLRSLATMMLWHHYIRTRNIQLGEE